jgi:hypothetical protein
MGLRLEDIKTDCRDDRYGYIYHTVFTRPTDGKLFHYIGQKRGTKVNHKYFGSGVRINNLVNKYGLNGNTKVFIVGWYGTKAELDAAEVRLIREAKRIWKRSCVNLAHGGANGALSLKSRQKLSETQLERFNGIDGERLRAALRERWASPESDSRRQKLIERNKDGASDETRAKMSAAKKGKPGPKHSEETKLKIGLANKGKIVVHTEESKRKISQAGKGKIRSAETRAKISEALKGRSFSDQHRANLVAAFKKRPPPSAETKARLASTLWFKKML